MADERSFYIDQFTDEVLPCEATLEGWAAWLAGQPELDEGGYNQWGVDKAPADGDTFTASATVWQPDIIATSKDGVWSLSRDPADNDFMAVRYGAGMGWSAEEIINVGLDSETCAFFEGDTGAAALLRWLQQNDTDLTGKEYVAVGTHESGWLLTFRSGPPPHFETERVQ